MTNNNGGAPRSLDVTQSARDKALALLQELFGNDEISLRDLETRTELVQNANSHQALDDAMRGLPQSKRPETALAKPVTRPSADTVVAVLGGAERKGHWNPQGAVRSVAVLGGSSLDFCDAKLNGIVDVKCTAVLGNVEITVPHDVRVYASGTAVMGSFPTFQQEPDRPKGDALIRISGIAVMGSVDVKVKRKGLLSGLKETLFGSEP